MEFLDRSVPKFAPRQRDYRRFIIVSAPRSGSSLLASLLRDHPEIVCHSELFHPQRVVLGPHHKLAPRDALLAYRRSHAIEFYHEVLHGPYDHGVKAVGFKLLYQQANAAGEHAIWKEMERDFALHVVHLARSSPLEQLISITQGNITGQWSATGSEERPPVRVALRPEHCEIFFRSAQRAVAQQRERFKAHPRLEVDYDELVRDRRGVLERVQAFLGVAPHELSSPLQRQNPYAPRQCVENYDELARHFRNTRWSGLFQ